MRKEVKTSCVTPTETKRAGLKATGRTRGSGSDQPLPTGVSAVLRLPAMRAVYLAHAISMLGTIAAEVALSVLVFQRTGSALLSALVFVCTFLPYAVGGTLLSSVADRLPARPLLVSSDLICAGCVAAMTIPGMPVPALLGLLVVTGLIAPVFQGARAASLAQLLDGDLFPVGRSLLRTISQTAVVSGFAVGGVLIALVGPRWVLVANAASFLVSAALLRLGTPATPANSAAGQEGAAAEPSVLRESLSGLRYLLRTARLRRLLLLSWAVPAFSSVGDGLAVAYTVQTGAAATAAGALFTGYAVGTVAGEITVARLSPATRRRLVVPLVILSQLPLVFFAASPSVPAAALLLALSGAGFAFNQGIDPLILAATEPAYRGRLFTVQSSGLMTVQGVGIALFGAAGTVFAPGLVVCAAGSVGAVVALTLARSALRATPSPVIPAPAPAAMSE
ncbi:MULTISPECIES: MFS transporter [unclassified Streptomyces]|uniref:MFS transporter n=1 Tax=unclassified Streptomyces TaxID=2593676 RepID=UPI002E2DA29E|nr:MFS transporter [Streptomyces sp. NBC_01439]